MRPSGAQWGCGNDDDGRTRDGPSPERNKQRGGAHTSQSNEGLALEEAVPMPANNFTLVWRKSGTRR
jgi:hypothetical protein